MGTYLSLSVKPNLALSIEQSILTHLIIPHVLFAFTIALTALYTESGPQQSGQSRIYYLLAKIIFRREKNLCNRPL